MIDTVAPLAATFDLHTTLFRNCLAGVDGEMALRRPNATTNSIAFIAGHLVESRAWMGRYLGLDLAPPFGGALEHATAIEQIPVLPTPEELLGGWDQVSGPVAARLAGLTGTDVAAPTPQRFPGVTPTVLGGIAFLVHHESYHTGQLALLRKYHGLAPMSYR